MDKRLCSFGQGQHIYYRACKFIFCEYEVAFCKHIDAFDHLCRFVGAEFEELSKLQI